MALLSDTSCDALARAAACGVAVGLDPAGELELLTASDIPADLVELLRAAKSEIIAFLRDGRIDAHIRARIIDWPPSHCLRCRKPVRAGQLWLDLSDGESRARLHGACHADWRVEAAQGLGPPPPPSPPRVVVPFMHPPGGKPREKPSPPRKIIYE